MQPLVQGVLAPAERQMDSPAGRLCLVASERGLAFVGFEGEQHNADTRNPTPEARAVVGEAERQLDEYFDGKRKVFDLDIDLTAAVGFRREVLEVLARVEYGTTVGYSELAAMAGRPKAVRAAATACATNPIPFVIPCHRVLRADGALGGYRGGLDLKAMLLRAEGVDLG